MVVYKKIKASREQGTPDNFTDNMAYAKPAVSPVQAIELQETEDIANETHFYETI